MKILLAIDGSQASQKAVRFVGELLGKCRPGDLSLTLYHVVETLPEYLLARSEEAGKPYRQLIDDLTASRRAAGEQLLAGQLQVLTSAGVPATAIHSKLEVRDALPESKKVVAALAIIEEMQRGGYCVVCLGRCGSSAAEGSFLGSVAEKVLREARDKSVWVID